MKHTKLFHRPAAAIAAVVLVVALSATAFAYSGGFYQFMTGGSVQNIVDEDGSVVFQHAWFRLCRRIVRDFKFRGADAEFTMKLWNNVCRGERLTPAIGGFFRTRLYLGTEPLEEEELRIIFRHELYHYRHGDIWIRRLLLLLRIFCWFCPWFTCGKISEEYRRLSEDYVDEEVCREEDMGRYIRTLLKTALQGAEKMHLTQVTAAENRCDVLRRIENMKNRQSKKQIRRTMAVIWIAACLFLGTAVVYAADTGVIKGYEALYRATVAENEDQGEQKIYIEYYEEPDDSWVAEEGEVMEIVNTSSLLIQDHLVAIDWTVEANAVRTTPSFEIYFPRDITMVVSAEPAGQEVRAGIVEPDGTRRYIIGSGTTVWSFSVDQDGRYKIFTENPNHTEAYVEISCWL